MSSLYRRAVVRHLSPDGERPPSALLLLRTTGAFDLFFMEFTGIHPEGNSVSAVLVGKDFHNQVSIRISEIQPAAVSEDQDRKVPGPDRCGVGYGEV